jgi:uncharacterized protein (TIGR03000 family)
MRNTCTLFGAAIVARRRRREPIQEDFIMIRNRFVFTGTLALALGAIIFFPLQSFAGPHGGGGGGHGGGGHGGGGHGGGNWHGGGGHGGSDWHGGGGHGGSDWHGGGGSWHGGGGNYYRGGYYPYYNRGFNWDDSFYPGYGIGFGSYPGYYGVYTPSYYSYDDVPSYRDSNVIYSSSSYTPTPSPAPAEDRAYMTIQLPVEKADVWIEGVKSVQDKASQDYVSPQLEAGKKYHYEVRARWTDARGKAVEAKRSFPILPGKPVLIDFTQPSSLPSEK